MLFKVVSSQNHQVKPGDVISSMEFKCREAGENFYRITIIRPDTAYSVKKLTVGEEDLTLQPIV